MLNQPGFHGSFWSTAHVLNLGFWWKKIQVEWGEFPKEQLRSVTTQWKYTYYPSFFRIFWNRFRPRRGGTSSIFFNEPGSYEPYVNFKCLGAGHQISLVCTKNRPFRGSIGGGSTNFQMHLGSTGSAGWPDTTQSCHTAIRQWVLIRQEHLAGHGNL